MFWIRIICLAISLMAAATAATWRLAPEWTRDTVREFERGRQQAYMAGPQHRFDAALQLLEDGERERATQDLLELCEDLEPVLKKDRLYKLRRRVLNRTVSLVELNQDWKRARKLAESLVETDPVDRPALLQLIRLRGIETGDTGQRVRELEAALLDLPTCDLTRQELTSTLIELDRIEDALDHEFASHERIPYQPYIDWRMYFRETGQRGFSGKTVALEFQPAPQQGVYWCTIPMLPGGVERVRLDPPANVGLLVNDPRVSVDGDGQKAVLSDTPPASTIRMQRLEDGAWFVPGGLDPQIHFAVPAESQAGDKSRVVLRIAPVRILPQDFHAALRDAVLLERVRNHLAGDQRAAHRACLETTLDALGRSSE
tara:strand:+ start:43043 stop:44158 length:1116 start_codon:yes stop_codon:yes gene_type:complete